jgi:SSS family transporter
LHEILAVAIGPVDALVVVVYVSASAALGIALGRGQADQRDFFLAGRRLPTWALLLSIVATETSTVTFLSVPGLSYVEGGSFQFLQLTFGYILGRLAIVVWLLPGYFRGEVLTAYQVLEQRFGLATRRLASLVFLVMRNLADGLRLFLTAVALNVAIGLDMLTSILVTAIATAIYACFGGVRSVVWNDCIQFGVYIFGALAAAWLLLTKIPGGWDELAAFGEATGRFQLLDFSPSLTAPSMTFWAGCIGGAFLSLASHGADQLIVQRYLCAKSQRSAGWALVLSGFIVLAQFALFLFIGVELACFHSVAEGTSAMVAGDQALMTFVVNHMGVGLKGLILAAVFAATMSTLSSSVNSSASSLTNDLLGRVLVGVDERKTLTLARALTLVFATVQVVVAIYAYRMAMDTSIIDSVLKIAGFATGLVLGLYGLGLIVPKATQSIALAAFAVGTIVTSWAAFATPLNGYWYTLIGSGTIVLVGLVLQMTTQILKPQTIALALAACFFAFAPAKAQAPAAIGRIDSKMGPLIDATVERSLARGEMAGCVVVVGRRDGIVFERAYGNRRVEPDVAPMTLDTVFDMASLTKPLAAATSVMILVERGEMRLQDKVADYFPEFSAHDKGDVTIEQLLVHSAGLIPDNSVDDYRDGWASAEPTICDLKLLTPPGTAFKYSDVGFILLGKIVEQVTGKPLDEFAKEEVYAKLGMADTGYLPPADLKGRAATTEQRDGEWLVGVVHDPRAALMGGVAGHAGLFSTAHDLAKHAQMMLGDGRLGDVRILGAATVSEMTRPRDVDGNKRGLGWDMLSVYSRNRGETMSPQAFGHGGFTGTAMWIDPELDLYVIFLSNRLHPDGAGEVNNLAGRIGTIAAGAIEPHQHAVWTGRLSDQSVAESAKARQPVRLGIDVLAADQFKLLEGKRVGLITNHTGCSSRGVSTAKLLHDAEGVRLIALFSPEHGIAGALDVSRIGDSTDESLQVPIYSLYGESRKPTSEQLAGIDTLVFDIQDIGTRFYTYIATMGLAMEAAAEAGKEFVVLDRPNPINGTSIEGPLRDDGRESFVAYHSIPVRHGMTVGELARMFAAERKLDLELTVIPTEGWRRSDYWHDTNLTWINPSPNMRSETEAVLYPGIGLLETTNISVGRGTDTPFEVIGAPWINERELADQVNRAIPTGVRVVPIRFTPTSSKFAGESCGGLNFVITDWNAFRSFDLGMVVAQALRSLYPNEWETKPYMKLLGSTNVYRRLTAGEDVSTILESVDEQVQEFRVRRAPFMLYPLPVSNTEDNFTPRRQGAKVEG